MRRTAPRSAAGLAPMACACLAVTPDQLRWQGMPLRGLMPLSREHARFATNSTSCPLPCTCAMQVDELRGSPMSVGSLEEIIDEKCALLCFLLSQQTHALHAAACVHAAGLSRVVSALHAAMPLCRRWSARSTTSTSCPSWTKASWSPAAASSCTTRCPHLPFALTCPDFAACCCSVKACQSWVEAMLLVSCRCCRSWASCRTRQTPWSPS